MTKVLGGSRDKDNSIIKCVLLVFSLLLPTKRKSFRIMWKKSTGMKILSFGDATNATVEIVRLASLRSRWDEIRLASL